MKLNTKIVAGLLATSALAFGLAAQAQPPGAGCEERPGMGMMRQGMGMMADPAARAERRMEQFKAQLKLTPQQEPLWTAFAEKAKAEAGKGMKTMREKAQEPMTAPERMSQMMNLMKDRMTAMESVSESFKRLYDGLTPEQKAIADKQPGIFGGRATPPRGKPATPPPQSDAGGHNHG